MKKIISLLLAFTMMISLTACGRESAEDAVNNSLTAVKELKFTQIYKYYELDLPENMEIEVYIAQFKENPEIMDTLKLFVNHFSYNITDLTEAENNAVATVEMTNIDMKAVMGEFVARSVSEGIINSMKPARERLTDEEMTARLEKILIDMLKVEDIKLATKTVKVVLNDVDGKWKVSNTEEVLDGITGGLITIAKNLKTAGDLFGNIGNET